MLASVNLAKTAKQRTRNLNGFKTHHSRDGRKVHEEAKTEVIIIVESTSGEEHHSWGLEGCCPDYSKPLLKTFLKELLENYAVSFKVNHYLRNYFQGKRKSSENPDQLHR